MANSYKVHETGIYEYLDRNRKRPFMWRQTIRGQKFSMAFDTLEKAIAAKESKLAEIRKYGDTALEFTFDDLSTLKKAKELLPSGVDVLEAARYYVKNHGSGRGLTISECIVEFIEHQRKLGNGVRNIANLRSHLLKLESDHGHLKARDVNRKTIMDVLDSMIGQLAPRTIANVKGSFGNFFDYLADIGEIPESPIATIGKKHLPKVKKVTKKNPLEVWQVAAIMALAEKEFPEYAYWLALQFFVGFREAEASRFRFEWVQPEFDRILIPGWFYDEGELEQGTKTQDDWMIDKVAGNFWYWHREHGQSKGPVKGPSNSRTWRGHIRDKIMAAGILEAWPHNAKRDTFCTMDISAYRDPQATALKLKHRNVTTLWESYMGCLKTEQEGRACFQVYPGASPFNAETG